MKRLTTLVIFFLAIVAPRAFAALSPAERDFVASVDENLDDALELLERSVNVNSGTFNFEGIRQVGDLFEKEFAALGFETRWVDGSAWGRAGHLIAERSGAERSPRILFIGHLDTVFEKDSPFQRYELAADSTARGPGVIDMKGGIVVMLLALGAMADGGAIDGASFRVVLTGDEEKAGHPIELARADLIEAARWADIAIGFEDGDGDPKTAVISRRGATLWRLETRGKPAHSSQVFRHDIGSGAIFEASRILAAFHDSLSGEPFLTFNPGVVLGGTSLTYDGEANRGSAFGKMNVVAESTVVAGDLRALSLEQREKAKATMVRIVEAHHPHTSASIVFDDAYPPLAPSPGNELLLDMYDHASRDLGHGIVRPVDPARAGAADISFTAEHVQVAMDGVGLMGDGGHTVDEYADLTTLAMQARRMALLLRRIAMYGIPLPGHRHQH